MNGEAWIGGVAATLWLAYMSAVARTWWVLLWFLALFFGLGTGLVMAIEHPAAAGLWWSAWLGYAVTLPIVRVRLARKHERSYYDEP